MKYSYCPTVLGRVSLDHECGANAGNGKKNGKKSEKTARFKSTLPHLYYETDIDNLNSTYPQMVKPSRGRLVLLS